MARFGRLPVELPQGVKAEITADLFRVTGPKGENSLKLPRLVKVRMEENSLLVEVTSASKQAIALQGTIKALIVNMIKGVSEGWSKSLELVGTGYRAEVQGRDLILNIGFSHPVRFSAPEGVTFTVEKSKITVSGIKKDVVGQISAQIRETRKPEPYQGKGIRYQNEVVRRKAGKQAAKAA